MAPETRMAVISICFAAGIAASANAHPMVWGGLVGLVALIILIVAKDVPRSSVLIGTVVFILGGVYFSLNRQIPPNDVSKSVFKAKAIKGFVASDPESNEERTRLILRVTRVQVPPASQRSRFEQKKKSPLEWRRASGRVMLYVYSHKPHLEYGDRLTVYATPYPPRDPTNPGQFSWKDYLARQRIYSCAYVRDESAIQKVDGKRGNILVSAALRTKKHVEKSIARITPKREAGVITGMVLGTYSYLPKETLANFGRTGTLHLLAASGYNCFILVFLASPFLRLIGLTPKYRNAALLCLIITYLLMVGPKPSLVRASLMAGLFLIAPLFRRVANVKNIFFFSALVLLAINPNDLFDIGFQLSFLAVWALITIAPVVEAVLKRGGVISKNMPKPRAGLTNRISSELISAAVATVSVTLFTAPVIAHYFNYFSLVSLPANMALALGVPLVFGTGLSAPVFASVPIVSTALGWFSTTVTRAMLGIVDYLGSWQHSALPVQSPGILWIVGYYIVLHALLTYTRSQVDA